MRRALTLLLGLLCGSTAHAEPLRLAWIGLERGPLTPAEADKLERLLIDDFDGYESFRLVDASGHALDARLLAAEAAAVARLKDEGITLALEFKTQRALKKFDQAIELFEARLVQLLDYELFHDTLLAKAETQFQDGQKAAAKATLEQLAALSPKTTPTAKTHPPGLVKLWEDAKEALGAVGTINVTCDGCTVQIDGQSLGPAPLLATRILPGKHYLVARWAHGFIHQTVTVTPGQEAKANVERSGPVEAARTALIGAIERRAGPAEGRKAAERSAKLAESQGVLLAAVKSDGEGKRQLYVARHDAAGEVVGLVRAPLNEAVEDERTANLVKRIGALMFVDRKRGEFLMSSRGNAIPATKLAEQLYEGAGLASAPPPPGPPPPSPPPYVPPDEEPPPVEEERSIAGEWWFWTILGGAVLVGAGVGVGIWAGTRDPTTTEFEVILP